jgi:hypothetical protein
MTEKEWYFSRGDAELYDKCPRARYHRTISGERGIVKIGSSFELSLGRIIHRATEWVLTGKLPLYDAAKYAASAVYKLVQTGEYPRAIPDEAKEQFVKESQALAEGLVWAWGLGVYPDIKANYNVIAVEEQTAYRKDGMVLPTVADVVLESKDDQTLVYPDWKTTAWVNAAWMDQWNRAAQLFTTVRAVEQVLDREVEYCYVQALVKGRWQKGYQQSPLCWAYLNESADGTEEDPTWSYKYKAGKKWRRTAPWLENIPMQTWVTNMPREILSSIVPRTPPIIVNPYLADTWWRQRLLKEQEISRAKQALADLAIVDKQFIMDKTFPQDFTQCDPVIGYACDYKDICHDPAGIGSDPIGSGLYRRRPTYQERLLEESVEEKA